MDILIRDISCINYFFPFRAIVADKNPIVGDVVFATLNERMIVVNCEVVYSMWRLEVDNYIGICGYVAPAEVFIREF